MRAIVAHAPHDLRIETFPGAEPLPPAPPAGQVRVRMAAGGICGSDLHYYHDGGFGVVRIKQPMTLGHEAAGRVEALGAGVSGLVAGDLVAVNPSQNCGHCAPCKTGRPRHCEDMRFNGSAMRFPHVQGLFRELIDVPSGRAFAMPAGVTPAEASLCEPFAVALHAVNQAGGVAGKRVLVSGCGPIGVLVIVAARIAGARQIVATDVAPHSLAMARTFGSDVVVDVGAGPDALAPFSVGRGELDAAFECSGSPRAFAPVVGTLRPGATLVAVGLGGDVTVPMNTLVAKEIAVVGTFRFDAEFAEAARLIGSRKVDLKPMISAVYPLDQALAAFDHASDKSRATKVVIDLSAAGIS
jgi:L-idonate 5-dehydrogenase